MKTAAQIESTITNHLNKLLPHHNTSEVYHYACLPGGKFFRPSLVWSICYDLNPELFKQSIDNDYSNHSLLASAVELHHSYTLIHDDLPSMDNDTIRRGKPCTHIQFGEWKALLTGDGLLNISYQLLAKTRHQRSLDVIKFFTWACGPKGLILGQVLDLSHEMTESFKNTLKTHKLKTARLIQVAVLCSAAFSNPRHNYNLEKSIWRYSELLGINFQLIDDLSEMAEVVLTEHENDVNPWLRFPNESLSELTIGLNKFKKLSDELNLESTNIMVSEYYKKMNSIIKPNLEIINNHLNNKLDLSPVVLHLDSFN